MAAVGLILRLVLAVIAGVGLFAFLPLWALLPAVKVPADHTFALVRAGVAHALARRKYKVNQPRFCQGARISHSVILVSILAG
jgi:hypothetical protein